MPSALWRFSTVARASSSPAIRAVARRQAWRTVVWSRPPKWRPMAGRDSSVSSRERYIASCRGHATRGVRAGERSSSRERPKSEQAASWMSRTVLGRARRRRVGVEVVEHFRGELGGQRAAGERAEGDDPDQSALERSHVALDPLGDGLQRPGVGELRRRRGGRACAGSPGGSGSRVAAMSATSPDSKRSRRRSSSSRRSRGGRRRSGRPGYRCRGGR